MFPKFILDPTVAIIPFAYDGNDTSYPLSARCSGCRDIVIVLTRDAPDDTTWGFEDINGHPVARYDAAPLMR